MHRLLLLLVVVCLICRAVAYLLFKVSKYKCSTQNTNANIHTVTHTFMHVK